MYIYTHILTSHGRPVASGAGASGGSQDRAGPVFLQLLNNLCIIMTHAYLYNFMNG